MKEFIEPVIELLEITTETVMEGEFEILTISFVAGENETPLG